jgi:Family of unknown function (DUF5947)
MTGATGLRRFVPGAQSAAAARPDQLPGAAEPAAGPGVRAAAGPAAAPDQQAGAAAEKCEMCATEIPAEHGHVADLEASTLVCACRACYLLFTQAQAGRGRYRSVPDRYLQDRQRPLTAAQWDQFDIPVGLAFFLRSSQRGEVTGFYPSPAGATECILDLRAWDALAADYPLLAAAAPDVEAALICRTDSGVEYFLVPIDACYELAGRMRLHWRGFDGGSEARASIEEFLGNVRSRARAFVQEATDG